MTGTDARPPDGRPAALALAVLCGATLMVILDGAIVTVFAFDVAGDRIRHIWDVRNSENSGPGRQADRVSQPDT